jgi:hypothetical protein
MFDKSDEDLSKTLNQMQDAAYRKCNCNQTAMIDKMASWLAQDRRFDAFADKKALAREALDARSHGRYLDLSGKPKFETNPMNVRSISDTRIDYHR